MAECAAVGRSGSVYNQGKATLLDTGSLTVADDIDSVVLADRLDKIHNFGEIKANIMQIAKMQARLGVNEGELIDTASGSDEDVDDWDICNSVYLKLQMSFDSRMLACG